jgi:hypothetical protein
MTAPQVAPRSTRRLSEVAKKLAFPSDIAYSDWDGVHKTCVNKLGLEFDGWQYGAGRLLLARNHQVGKTSWAAGSLFGMCVEMPGLLVIWSAHHSKTHNETFQAMQAFAARTKIAPFIQKVFTGSGDEEVRFFNGSRILFGARERGFGRGIPGVDVLVSDEGQILSERAMQNMLATLNTSKLGLHLYLGTPPGTEDYGKAEMWMRMRTEAWAGEVNDMVWIEIGADDDADLDDHNQWAKANPSYPHRTPLESIMRLRRKLNDDGFRREALGLYDQDDGSIFDISKWTSLIVEHAEQPKRAALVLDVSPDRRWCAIGIAGDLPVDSDLDDEKTLVMVKSIRGTEGVVREIARLNDTQDLVDIAITNGAARALETDLVKASIQYHTLTQGEMSAAYGNLQRAIRESTVAHIGQNELDFALANSKSRYLQTGEAESFDRREYSVDISPAVATAGALYRWGLQSAPLPLIM